MKFKLTNKPNRTLQPSLVLFLATTRNTVSYLLLIASDVYQAMEIVEQAFGKSLVDIREIEHPEQRFHTEILTHEEILDKFGRKAGIVAEWNRYYWKEYPK